MTILIWCWLTSSSWALRHRNRKAASVDGEMTTSKRQRVSAAVAWLSAGLAYLTLEGIAAAAFRPRYSYAHNFISDLGIPSGNSPLAWLMNTAFGVQGTLFLVGAILTVRAVEARKAGLFVALVAANAVGNLLIAAFHSGPASHA